VIEQLQKLRGRLAYWETRLRLETRSWRRRELERLALAEIGRLASFASPPTKPATVTARAAKGGRVSKRTD
jgi:hypothetical protein